MAIENYITAEANLLNTIHKITNRVRQHQDGKIDGITVNKTDVMNNAKAIKTELLEAWNAYKTELQNLVS